MQEIVCMVRYRCCGILLLIICFTIIFTIQGVGQENVVTSVDSIIQVGIELSIQHKYEQAEEIFKNIIKQYPEHPIGYFFMAATIQSKLMDYETDKGDKDFYRYIKLTNYYVKKKIATSSQKDPWLLFCKGSALCYQAFFESRKGKYVLAVKHGFSGISILKKIVRDYPEFYDVYFGIGSYKYWRSYTTRHLNWLPILSDERIKGIEMVKLAVESGKYTQYAAMNELIWILIDSEKPEEAYSWTLRGLKKFPQSRFFLWGAAKSTYAMEKYPEAVKYYQELLSTITCLQDNNHYNEYICRLNLAKSYVKLESFTEATIEIEILKTLSLSEKIAKKLSKQKKEAAALENEIRNNLYAKQSANNVSTSKNNFTDEQSSQ